MKTLTNDEKKNLECLYTLLNVHFRFLHSVIVNDFTKNQNLICSDYLTFQNRILKLFFQFDQSFLHSLSPFNDGLETLTFSSLPEIRSKLKNNQALKILQEELSLIKTIAQTSPEGTLCDLSSEDFNLASSIIAHTNNTRSQSTANPIVYTLKFEKNTGRLILNDTLIVHTTYVSSSPYKAFSTAFDHRDTVITLVNETGKRTMQDMYHSDTVAKTINTNMSPVISKLKLPRELRNLFFQSGKTKFAVYPVITAEMLRKAGIDFYKVNLELFKKHELTDYI